MALLITESSEARLTGCVAQCWVGAVASSAALGVAATAKVGALGNPDRAEGTINAKSPMSL